MSYRAKKKIQKSWIMFVTIVATLTSSCYLDNVDDLSMQYYQASESEKHIKKSELNDFVASVKKVDGQADSHYKLALHFQKRRRHNLAVEEFERALHLDPSMAKAYNAMGISYDKLGSHEKAIECYKRALKLDRKLDHAYNNLGYSYMNIKKYDSAIESFEKAITINNKNRRFKNNLVLAYIMKEDYYSAIKNMRSYEDEENAEEFVRKVTKRVMAKYSEKKLNLAIQKIQLEDAFVGQIKDTINNAVVKQVEKQVHVEKGEVKSNHMNIGKDVNESNDSDKKLALEETEIVTNGITLASMEPNYIPKMREGNKTHKSTLDGATDNTERQNTSDIYFRDNNKNNSTAYDKNISKAETTQALESPTHNSGTISVKWEDDSDLNSTEENVDSSSHENYMPNNSIYTDTRIQKNSYSKHKVPDKLENGKSNNSFKHVSENKITLETLNERTVVNDDRSEENNNKKGNSTLEHKTENKKNTIRAKNASVTKKANTARIVNLNDYRERVKVDAVNKKDKAKTSKKIYPIYTTKVGKIKSRQNRKITVVNLSHVEQKNTLTKNTKSINTLIDDIAENEIIEVEIANGNGVNGMARRYKKLLEKKGFNVIKISNANYLEHIKTKIFYYARKPHDVRQLIKEIGIFPDGSSVIELKKVGSKIKIIIGRDLIKQNRTKLASK